MLVCLFVCLYPINVKTAELIESKFLRGNLHDPGQGRLMDDQNKKNAIKKGGTGEGTLSETKKESEKVKRRKLKMKERRKREESLIFVTNIMCKGLSSN